MKLKRRTDTQHQTSDEPHSFFTLNVITDYFILYGGKLQNKYVYRFFQTIGILELKIVYIKKNPSNIFNVIIITSNL